eukprot:CAMPEP_0197832326 /NCGR_PEP_ID=MMETSP1437-20131217/14294_1 /TAXON_ID=49252 ORGANISM="Eucampia antarctica, Strain CCMP1452" /NCGR_SAMPLE_ID=MMETSP1437 /ASSEMBLY_ACC=CAM_ASM_001096 /LENGTH=649 /DNA_ID=CAMNT_0043435651 /DNA_START=16 /DNA_END=1962 /DNA_ORIENTATION=-
MMMQGNDDDDLNFAFLSKPLHLSRVDDPTTMEHERLDNMCEEKSSSSSSSSSGSSKNKEKRVRIVAAKVELASFSNSGVLDGEATILEHLAQTISEDVPLYLDHVRDAATQNTAIIMEYLAGRDMHQLRDLHATQRRISIADAVYLCADVFLPLLKHLHQVGVVHRDVKPSNCVATDYQKKFKLVDFGLSKSLVVPSESSLADERHVWTGAAWHSSSSPTKGCLRKERDSAEFRGTSMYASLRVHQNKDYCRRDDLWGLLYVFCDLVSGGLPWMSHAAARDRKACHTAKEDIQQNHKEAQLIMGAEYHISMHRRNEAQKKNIQNLPPPAQPLAISNDTHKVQMLREAFDHVSSLEFVDEPNYDLIRQCLKSFEQQSSCPEQVEAQEVNSIPWNTSQKSRAAKSKKNNIHQNEQEQILWKTPIILPEQHEFDPQENLEQDDWREAEMQQPLAENSNIVPGNNTTANTNSTNATNNHSTENETGCLPLYFQYRLAQMEYNARHPTRIASHLALRDWMACATPLLKYASWWNVAKFERHAQQRTNEDGYRRDFLKKCLQFCLHCAQPFDNFHNPDVFFVNKRQRRSMTHHHDTKSSCLLHLSRTLHALRAMLDEENDKSCAPPPTISFHSNNTNKIKTSPEIPSNSLPDVGG